jgi:hypothetical protein
VLLRSRNRQHLGSNPSLGGSHPSVPAASMDATQGIDRGCDPLRLLRPPSSCRSDRTMATKGAKGPWARTTLRVASIDAAEVSRRAPGGEASGPRPRDPGAQTAAWTEAPRLEAPPRGLPSLRVRGVYGRHARPRPRMQPLAPFAANLRSVRMPLTGWPRGSTANSIIPA